MVWGTLVDETGRGDANFAFASGPISSRLAASAVCESALSGRSLLWRGAVLSSHTKQADASRRGSYITVPAVAEVYRAQSLRCPNSRCRCMSPAGADRPPGTTRPVTEPEQVPVLGRGALLEFRDAQTV